MEKARLQARRVYRDALNELAPLFGVPLIDKRAPPTLSKLEAHFVALDDKVPADAANESRVKLSAAKAAYLASLDEIANTQEDNDDEEDEPINEDTIFGEEQTGTGVFRLACLAFLLTFNFEFLRDQWQHFVNFVKKFVGEHHVRWAKSDSYRNQPMRMYFKEHSVQRGKHMVRVKPVNVGKRAQVK